MITFEVKDMACVHCDSTITKAVKTLDKDAQVNVDLIKQMVQIEPADSGAQELSDAIKEAAYSPVQVIESAKITEGAGSSTRGRCH